jgi:hypothetical protein
MKIQEFEALRCTHWLGSPLRDLYQWRLKLAGEAFSCSLRRARHLTETLGCLELHQNDDWPQYWAGIAMARRISNKTISMKETAFRRPCGLTHQIKVHMQTLSAPPLQHLLPCPLLTFIPSHTYVHNQFSLSWELSNEIKLRQKPNIESGQHYAAMPSGIGPSLTYRMKTSYSNKLNLQKHHKSRFSFLLLLFHFFLPPAPQYSLC